MFTLAEIPGDGALSCLHETPEESRIGKLTDCSSGVTKSRRVTVICQTMWLDQSEEIIVYEHCIICQTIWDDRSGQVQIACLTSHHMEKVVFAIAG